MAKFVPDAKTRRWVVIAPERSGRLGSEKREAGNGRWAVGSGKGSGQWAVGKAEKPPVGVEKKPWGYWHKDCPFCVGNESQTPPEIYRIDTFNTSNMTNKTNMVERKVWSVRVVPNKFPITDIHEVIIHSPDHWLDIADYSREQMARLINVYRGRYNALCEKGQVFIFRNFGKRAGPSQDHPHSQIAVVPHQIKLDTLSLEPADNVIIDNKNLVVYCPDFSQWPFEIWIAAKNCCEKGHQCQEKECGFGAINDEVAADLAAVLKEMIGRLSRLFGEKLAYNYYIYPGSCWYLRIIPRLVKRAGFELGTGLSVNIVDPKEAAERISNF